MKAKKAALVYNWTLTFMVIFILAWTLIQFNSKYNKYELVGKKQLGLFKIYQKAESPLFYLDQSAKYSLQQSVYELAQNGGFVSEFDVNEININQPFSRDKCGKFKDVYVWYELKKDESDNYVKSQCFDENFLNINLVFYLDNILNQYLINSPYNIQINNYEYKVKDNEVIGKAKLPLKFDILKDEAKQVLKKSIEVEIEQLKLKDFTDETEPKLCAKGIRCLLTEEAYNLLLEAQKIADKKGEKLVVNSAFRSQDESVVIWEKFASTYPNIAERRKKVCDPISKKCPHTTGNAVDIVFEGKTTITMKNIDWLTLHEIMTSVKNDKGEPQWVRYGVENRYDLWEPWHFECCGTNRHSRAKEKGLTAIV